MPPEPHPVIEAFSLGPFETNCYVVRPPDEARCWIIDASFEPAAMIDRVRRGNLEPEALILTHAHADHIAGVGEVIAAFKGTPVWIHASEANWLGDPELNLSASFGLPVTSPGPDRTLEGGETLSLGPTTWRVIHTPGHSPGGITLHHADSATAIVGDTLFAGSIGRFDFPTSDGDALAQSIAEKLYALPDETTVYPGHGPTTTIGREKRTNPFVRAGV